MADEKVRQIQEWLVNRYDDITLKVDGYTGWKTVTALIKALQKELGFEYYEIDGSFGPGTEERYNTLYPNGLSSTEPSWVTYILRCGMYCRGIDGGTLDEQKGQLYTADIMNAVLQMKEQLGLVNYGGDVKAIDLKAVLTTDAYTNVGDEKVREIQQRLNRDYLGILHYYLPTNGLYERETNTAIKKAIQLEIGATVDGSWGTGTKNALPALSVGSNRKKLVYLLQYLLYLNGFDPNGFDGSFGNGARTAVMNFQKLMKLEVDGSVGPQTWFALVLSCGDTSRSANACDTCFEITPERARVLKNNGFEIVGRYLSGYINEKKPKAIQEGELQVIFAAGLKAFFIYQENNRQLEDFSKAKGYQAGASAYAYAKKHRIPKNTVIYFAVDFDVYEEDISEYIIPYFKGINYALHDYKVGIYAARQVCTKVAEAGLSISSFVADMSTGYSCNIGRKIPNNWCYDQFVEISNYNNDFDIDKVTYNGSIPACESLAPLDENINLPVYTFLQKIYDIAEQYCQENNLSYDIPNKNLLVLQYLRCDDYAGAQWDIIAESLDQNWISYIKKKIDNNEKYGIYIYTKNHDASYKMGLIHWAITTETNMTKYNSSLFGNDACTAIKDLAGWAGDLMTFTGALHSDYVKNGTPKTREEIKQLLGKPNEGKFTFPYEDLVQDIDAVNIYPYLFTKNIVQAVKEYYDNNANTNRYTKFLANLLTTSGFPTGTNSNSSEFDILYAMAYKYLDMNDETVQGIYSRLFSLLIDGANFNKETWRIPVSTAWADKISYFIDSEEVGNI